MPSRTIDQQRADFAYQTMTQYGQHGDDAKKFATLVRGLPTMVLQNGLGQALAYLLADAEGKKSPSQELYQRLQEWLCGATMEGRPERVYEGKLIEQLMRCSRDDYQRAQQSALGLLAWMRKFADAFLPKGDR